MHLKLLAGNCWSVGLRDEHLIILPCGVHRQDRVLLHVHIVGVLQVFTLLRKPPSVWHPEALSGLSEGQVHAVVLLLLVVKLLDSVSVLHHRDICAINRRRVSFVKLRGVVHKRAHIWVHFPMCIGMRVHRVV